METSSFLSLFMSILIVVLIILLKIEPAIFAVFEDKIGCSCSNILSSISLVVITP